MTRTIPRNAVFLGLSRLIPEGQSRGFDPADQGQDSLFLVRVKGKLYGWRNACPHIDGAPMAWRKDAYLNAKRTHIACHAHGALFEPETGLCIQGPCLGKRLQAVDVIEDDNGQVMICP
ncbi:Rieske (2Fe-2S) protein [Amphritea sp.]|uniref:Rieske (2Fe-2S) protein n=1 Tax=Amphritea sp. TaxID=1872502 RepID=UPI003A94105A